MDAEKVERDRDAVRRRRYVRLSDRGGGVYLEGLLDPVAGEHVRAALDAASYRPPSANTVSTTPPHHHNSPSIKRLPG
ncbi:hypothetical protein [Spelaeicoccus albus]